MFFVLSKLLIYFLYPFSWVLLLLIFACFLKNKKQQRQLLITAFVLLLVFSNSFLLKQFSRFWDYSAKPINSAFNYSCALVLGGYVSEDNAGKGYFNDAADRYIQAIKLKETGKVAHLLFSGGNASLTPSGFNEGSWLQAEIKTF